MPATLSAVALSLLAAWIHFAYIAPHWRSWWAYGLFFLLCGVGQGLFACALLRRPGTAVVLAGIAGNLAIIGMYVMSRTAGAPIGPHAGVAERATPVDLACTAAEILLVALLLGMLGRQGRRWITNGLLVAGALLWVLRMTGNLA